MGRLMQTASFSFAELNYQMGGDIALQIVESAKNSRVRVKTKQDNVSGVLLPAFDMLAPEGKDDFALTGLGKGGQKVKQTRETYAQVLEVFVTLANLQTAFTILDEVIKTVNRRGKFLLLNLTDMFQLMLAVNAMYTITPWRVSRIF